MSQRKNSQQFLSFCPILFKRLEEIYEAEKTNNSKLTKFFVYFFAQKLNKAIVETRLHHDLGKKDLEINAVRNMDAIIDEIVNPKRKAFGLFVCEIEDLLSDVLLVNRAPHITYTAEEIDCLCICKNLCELYLLAKPRLDSMHLHVLADEVLVVAN